MSNTKHTPGPWFLVKITGFENEEKKGVCQFYIDAPEAKHRIYNGPNSFSSLKGRNKQEAEANAKLIAAAPELLEALRCVVREMNLDEATCADKIFAALKKATDE